MQEEQQQQPLAVDDGMDLDLDPGVSQGRQPSRTPRFPSHVSKATPEEGGTPVSFGPLGRAEGRG